MLQFFVDDSRQDTPPIYVLGGYLAEASSWVKFSEEWAAELRSDPLLRRLKASSIRHELGGRSDEKLKKLYPIIERHVEFNITLIMNPDIIKDCFPANSTMSRHPFYCMAGILIPEVILSIENLGLSYDDVEFVFDDQMKEKANFWDAWNLVSHYLGKPENPIIHKLMKRTPRFESDEVHLPLQAADWSSWMVRRSNHENIHGSKSVPLAWPASGKIRHRIIKIDKDRLLKPPR